MEENLKRKNLKHRLFVMMVHVGDPFQMVSSFYQKKKENSAQLEIFREELLFIYFDESNGVEFVGI